MSYYGRRARRSRTPIADARRAYAMSAQGTFEIARQDFNSKAALGDGWWERREAGRRALEAGERRIAEVAGTQFEQSWRDAVDGFRATFAEWEAKYPEASRS